jgi:hypothetical protein
MAHLLLLARYFPKLLTVTKTPIVQGLRVYIQEKFLRGETKCDKNEQLLSQEQQMSQGLERKPGLSLMSKREYRIMNKEHRILK